MTEYELTPTAQRGYDGYMPDATPQEQNFEEQENTSAIRPAPVGEIARDLMKRAKDGTETGDVPENVLQENAQKAALKAKNETSNKPTREVLVDLSRDILRMTDPGQIRSKFGLIEGWGNILKKYLPETETQNKEFKALIAQIQKISGEINRGKDQLQDRFKAANNEPGVQIVLAQRPAISEVAQKMEDYFKKGKLITKEDYFRPIASFEELLSKIADFTSNDNFKPGGKFQLLEIKKTVDYFGRERTEEIAHPENFLEWMRDQIWFFDDFSPTSNIELFRDIAIPTATRQISLGEILYGAASDPFFAHRVPKVEQVIMTELEMKRIQEQYPDIYKYTPAKGGKDATYTVTKDGSVEVFTLKPNSILGYTEADQPIYGFGLTDAKGEEVLGEKLEKTEWNTKKDPRYDKVKNDVLWEAFLKTNIHNYDVSYRIKGMATEKALNEVMAEICGVNMLTQDRERLLRLFRMQSAENGQEAETLLGKGAGEKQGSVGKAMQRILAGNYHLAESSAELKVYKMEGGNPFIEVMKGNNGFNGAEEFYKSLINQTMTEEFDEQIGGIKILVDRLNKQKITYENDPNPEGHTLPDGQKPLAESLRTRDDWEKVQISEVAFLSRDAFMKLLRTRYGITENEFTAVYDQLEKDFKNGYDDDEGNHHDSDDAKVQQLQTIGNPKAVFEKLSGKHGLKPSSEYVTSFIDAQLKAKDGFTDLQKFGVRFFIQPFDPDSKISPTPSTNVFENISYDQRAAKRVRMAMREVVTHTEKLSEFEAKYAEAWAFNLVYITGIGARNDMQGIGHDAWSKIQNTEFYRLRQSGGGNYLGNLDNLFGIHRLGVNMWEGLKVQQEEQKLGNKSNAFDRTLYEVLTGFYQETKDGPFTFHINQDVGTFDFYGNAQRQFYADHLNHVIELFIDITQKTDMNLDKLVKYDNFGHLTWNSEEMQKMIDSTWKHLRYGFDNRGFLYDNTLYGWWYDETINADGQVSRKPHFGKKTMRELMFSEKVRDLHMYGQVRKVWKKGKEVEESFGGRTDLSGWTGPDNYHTKMARNVFAYLISAQLREHTRPNGGHRIYSSEEVEIITQAFMNYAARVMKGFDGETIVMSGFFNPEEIMKILVSAHAVLWMLYAKEYGISIGGGFLFGIFEAFALVMKQVGAGIKL